MSLSILVVTYNCSIEQSQTIQSFLSSEVGFDGARLCIWNNGPKEIPTPPSTLAALSDKGFEVTIKQTPWNAPLSWIYNYFIESYPSHQYVILDHDSTLPEEYLKYVTENKRVFFGMPAIQAKGKLLYPRVKKQFSSSPYTKDDKVFSITSGLLISQDIVDIIKDSYGNAFDENFALYGVDTSLFNRIHKLQLVEKLKTIPSIEHSLSNLEIEDKETQRFRKVERSYDAGLMLRHYPTSERARALTKQIFKCLSSKNKILITKAIKAFIQGRHERCKQSKLNTLIG